MRFEITLYMCLILCVVAYGRDGRIIGGKSSSGKKFPFMASLRIVNQTKHLCAGVIITSKHVLSAAHCIYRRVEYYQFVRVHVGISNLLDTKGKVYPVEGVTMHDGFVGNLLGTNGYHNDIVVYQIEGHFTFGKRINKISLPSKDLPAGSSVVLSGWGLTNYPDGENANQIQELTVKTIGHTKCQAAFNFTVLPDILCTDTHKGGMCTGDSGGPVSRHGKLVAIMSNGKPCATGVPDFHTNVFKHMKFIKSVIKNVQ